MPVCFSLALNGVRIIQTPPSFSTRKLHEEAEILRGEARRFAEFCGIIGVKVLNPVQMARQVVGERVHQKPPAFHSQAPQCEAVCLHSRSLAVIPDKVRQLATCTSRFPMGHS